MNFELNLSEDSVWYLIPYFSDVLRREPLFVKDHQIYRIH